MLRSVDPRRLVPRRRLVKLADEQLVVLVRRGDQSAFEELFDRHSAGVLSFCRRFLCSREEGEDALQHTFLAAYQAIRERGVEPRALRPWLYTIARNRCLSVLRSPREAALPQDQKNVAAAEQTADRVELQAEVRELLRDVANLPEQQRAALLLSEVCAFSHAQIAPIVDCRRENVKSLVFQARVSPTDRHRATGGADDRPEAQCARRARWRHWRWRRRRRRPGERSRGEGRVGERRYSRRC